MDIADVVAEVVVVLGAEDTEVVVVLLVEPDIEGANTNAPTAIMTTTMIAAMTTVVETPRLVRMGGLGVSQIISVALG